MIASITPSQQGLWHAELGAASLLSDHPTFDNYVELFVNNPFALVFPQQHHHRHRQHAADAAGGEPRRVRVRALPFAGRSSLLIAMLVAYTIPSVVLLVPLLVIFRTYGLINTHLGMVLAEATHAPVRAAAAHQLFLDAAARARRAGARRRLHAPRRAVAHRAAFVGARSGRRWALAFIMTWNNFLFAFLLTRPTA
jgi:ABC-type glycerol-3-phosphate transport system permease component